MVKSVPLRPERGRVARFSRTLDGDGHDSEASDSRRWDGDGHDSDDYLRSEFCRVGLVRSAFSFEARVVGIALWEVQPGEAIEKTAEVKMMAGGRFLSFQGP